MLILYPRRKLESLKADYAARNPSAGRLENQHIAAIMGSAPSQVAGWFHRDFDARGQASNIPPDAVGRLIAWLKNPSAVGKFPDLVVGEQAIHIENDWMILPWADFEARRAAAGSPLVVAHPRTIFGGQINDPSFLAFRDPSFPAFNAFQLQGALGLADAEKHRKPKFPFDPEKRYVATFKLRVEMPFQGSLTVVGADAVDGSWKFLSFDPFLNIERRPMERGYTLPYQTEKKAIPLYGPAGDCLIIGIATREKLRLPWANGPKKGEGVREVDVEDLRDISGQLKNRNPKAYQVGLLEYEMIERVADARGPARR